MNESKATLSLEVGCLTCGAMRNFLNQCQWDGYKIEWIESGGFFSRVFKIRGPESLVLRIKNHLEKEMS